MNSLCHNAKQESRKASTKNPSGFYYHCHPAEQAPNHQTFGFMSSSKYFKILYNDERTRILILLFNINLKIHILCEGKMRQ